MPVHEDIKCPFCGVQVDSDAEACPACDLPLLGADGAHPPTRSRTPFDGAAIFEDAPSGGADWRARSEQRQLALERSARADEPLRCVVVAINEAEAEMLCEMLRGEGVPCMVRTPDLHSYAQLSARCEVLVPESLLANARELLRIEAPQEGAPGVSPHFFTIGLMLLLVGVAVAIALAITWGS